MGECHRNGYPFKFYSYLDEKRNNWKISIQNCSLMESFKGYIFFDVGIASLSLIGYIFQVFNQLKFYLKPIWLCIKDWKNQALLLSLYPLILLSLCFYLPKSLQFVYSNGKYDEGKLNLKRFMKKTRSDVSKLNELSSKLEQISSQAFKIYFRKSWLSNQYE